MGGLKRKKQKSIIQRAFKIWERNDSASDWAYPSFGLGEQKVKSHSSIRKADVKKSKFHKSNRKLPHQQV